MMSGLQMQQSSVSRGINNLGFCLLLHASNESLRVDWRIGWPFLQAMVGKAKVTESNP